MIAEMRNNFFFENTKSSIKQIVFIEFINNLIPTQPVKFVKQKLLGDLMRHTALCDPESNITVKAQLYFLANSVSLINQHLTNNDQDFVLLLIQNIDSFKNQDQNEQLSEAAFRCDDKNKFKVNLTKQDISWFLAHDKLKKER